MFVAPASRRRFFYSNSLSNCRPHLHRDKQDAGATKSVRPLLLNVVFFAFLHVGNRCSDVISAVDGLLLS